MPGMNKYRKTPSKLSGRVQRAKMSGKGMPRPTKRKGPAAAMPSKGR